MTTSAYARTLLDDQTAAEMRATLGLSANGSSLVTAADYAAMRALLDLEAGTDFLSPAAIAAAYQPIMVRATAVAASGTSVDFTGISASARRITLMLDGVSTNGTSEWLVQIGDSGGVETSGYLGNGTFLGATTGGTAYTAGFGLIVTSAAHVMQGMITLVNLTGNVWVASGTLGGSGGGAAFNYSTAGGKTLSAVLDRVRLTTVGGADTFDAGTINILVE